MRIRPVGRGNTGMNHYKRRLAETESALIKTIEASIKLRKENARLKARLKALRVKK